MALLLACAVFGGALTSGYAICDLPASASRHGQSPLSALGSGVPGTSPPSIAVCGVSFGDLLIVLPLLWPRPRGSGRGRDLMLAACAASLVLGHSFYYCRSTIYSGPRLAFEALAPLALLAARSLTALGELLETLLVRLRSPELRRPVRLAVLGIGSAALLYFPLGQRLPEQMVKHAQWYMFVGGEPMRKATAAGVGRDALVFVASSPEAYPTFFLENDFAEAHGRVFVRDIPPLRAAAVAAYPRREIWQVKVVIESLDPVRLPEFGRAQPVTWTRLQ